MENPNNKKYKEYASLLFEFNQVKQEIQHLKNPLAEQGKINTKKFIEGVLVKLLNE